MGVHAGVYGYSYQYSLQERSSRFVKCILPPNKLSGVSLRSAEIQPISVDLPKLGCSDVESSTASSKLLLHLI